VGHGTTKPMNGLQHSNAPCCVTDDSRPATTRLRVLLVEDNPADVELVLAALRKDGFDVSSDVVQTVEEFTLRIQANGFDVILADYNLPQWRGMEALEILRCENLDVPLIVVTGYLGEEKAVECIKRGARKSSSTTAERYGSKLKPCPVLASNSPCPPNHSQGRYRKPKHENARGLARRR
jgi:CheY-like chemotaxis protein